MSVVYSGLADLSRPVTMFFLNRGVKMAGKGSAMSGQPSYDLDYFVGISLNEVAVRDGVGYDLGSVPPPLLAEVMKTARINFMAFLMSGVGGRMLNAMTDIIVLSERVGLTVNQTRTLLNDPEMRTAMAHWHNGADEMLRRRAALSLSKAMDAMEDIMDAADDEVKPHHRVAAAKTLSEIYKAVQPVVQGGGQTVNVQVNSAASQFASDAAVPVIDVAPRRYLTDTSGDGSFVADLAEAAMSKNR